MPQLKLLNNANSTLAVAVTSSGQATLQVQSGHGARFPAPLAPDYFMVTLDDTTNVEICKCIARSGDVLTVLRGYEGTTAQSAFATSTTKVQLRLTADQIDWLQDYSDFTPQLMKAPNSVGSFQMIGIIAPTIVGSTVASARTNSSWRESQSRIGITFGNSAGTCEVRAVAPLASGQAGFRFSSRFGFKTLPNTSHFFLGLVNTTGQLTSIWSPNSLMNGIGIGYVGSGLGANLQIIRCDSVAGATLLDLGSLFTANTLGWYQFDIDVDPGDTKWYYRVRRLDISSIADVASYFTTKIPSNSLWLSPYAKYVALITSGGAFELGGWSIE
jgi:hypothetical protein